jgi:hypothetical protein
MGLAKYSLYLKQVVWVVLSIIGNVLYGFLNTNLDIIIILILFLTFHLIFLLRNPYEGPFHDDTISVNINRLVILLNIHAIVFIIQNIYLMVTYGVMVNYSDSYIVEALIAFLKV